MSARRTSATRIAGVITLAVCGMSMAAPLVRLSHSPPLTVATWRLGLAVVLVLPFFLAGRGWRQWRMLPRGDLVLGCCAGVALAIDFWSWTTSLALTTVAASVVLINTQGLMVGLLSTRWLGEAPTARQWAGIALATAGAAIVGLADAGRSGHAVLPHAALGDGLALVAALSAACYFSAGRRLRARLDIWPYVTLVYSVCFLSLLVFAAATRAPLLPEPPREVAIFTGLALGPMLLGQTGMNWALKHVPAYVVALAKLGEPVVATLIVAFMPSLREVPPPLTLVGAGVVLAGVALGAIGAPSGPPAPPAAAAATVA
jgi:drug/metabolite transporter (DMT)-like permease